MPNADAKHVLLAAARELLRRPIDFGEFLAKLTPKDRAAAEKRVAALEAAGIAPGLADLWRRLACTLMTLAPHAAKLVGRQTVQYYVADGKYRMQVFALEDLQDGHITVYCPDVLAEAAKAGVLGPSARVPGQAATTVTGGDDDAEDGGGPRVYAVEGSREPLWIETLDKNSLNPAAHFKDMVGWNRKALRITLPPAASPGQVAATELLCAIAARHFPKPASAPAAGGAATPAPGGGARKAAGG